MRRFFSIWLVLIVIAVFALAMLLCAPLLTKNAEQTATADLNALLDAAFAQFDAVGADAEAVAQVSESNVLAKARAVARFLAHDDALLQTDALVSLCELLEVAAVDVTDYSGVVVASSVVGRIGRDLTGEPGTAWTKEVLDGEDVERTRVDETDQALLWGCVPRTDTEGFVLVQSLDTAILTAYASTDPELVLREFSFISDELTIDPTAGDDGAYLLGERYYVRRTEPVSGEYGSLTLLASRSLSSVYVLRNAVLLVLAVIGLISVVCALVIQVLLLRRRLARSHIAFDQKPRLPKSLTDEPEPLPEAEEAEAALPPAGEPAQAQLPAASEPEPPTDRAPDAEPGSAPEPAAPDAAQKTAKRRKRGPRKKIFEFVPVEDAAQALSGEPGDADADAPDDAAPDADRSSPETPLSPAPEPAEAMPALNKKPRPSALPPDDAAPIDPAHISAEPALPPRSKRPEADAAPAEPAEPAESGFDKIF